MKTEHVIAITILVLLLATLIVLIVKGKDKKKGKGQNNLGGSTWEIPAWVKSLNMGLKDTCLQCVVGAINKTWQKSDFDAVKSKTPEEQLTILKKLIAFNCPTQC